MKQENDNIVKDSNDETNKKINLEEILHFDNDEVTVIDAEVNLVTDLEELQKEIKIEYDPEPIEEIAEKKRKKIISEIIDDKKEEKPLKLTRQEKRKLRIINRLIAGEINGPKAAKMLKITTRQVRNLKRQVLEQGEAGVIHKNRYYKPVNTYEVDIRKEIANTYRKEFRGTNFTEFARIMQERGYELSRSTIYNILRENRIRSPQRKRKKRKKKTTTTTETVKK